MFVTQYLVNYKLQITFNTNFELGVLTGSFIFGRKNDNAMFFHFHVVQSKKSEFAQILCGKLYNTFNRI